MANLIGRTGTAAPFPTSETVGTSVADPKLGAQFIDGDGNVYVVVDCQEAFVAGEWAVINSTHEATQLTSNSRGRVGVIVAAVSASDTKAFMQVYGVYAGAAGTSDVTTAVLLTAPATTDIGGVNGHIAGTTTGANLIFGAWARTAAASDTTSPASSFVNAAGTSTTYIGFTVELNFPYVNGMAQDGGLTS